MTPQDPALFRQTRVGLDGRLFTVLKLRTMRQDADRVVDVLADANESDRDGVLFKIRRDPRITRLGRDPAEVLARRAAAADQRGPRRDVADRSPAGAAVRGARPTAPTCGAAWW